MTAKLNEIDVLILEILASSKDSYAGRYESKNDLMHVLTVNMFFKKSQVDYSLKKLEESGLVFKFSSGLYTISGEGTDELVKAKMSNIFKNRRQQYVLPKEADKIFIGLQKNKREYGAFIDLEKGIQQHPERISIIKGSEDLVDLGYNFDFEMDAHTHPSDAANYPSGGDVADFLRKSQQVSLIYCENAKIVLEKQPDCIEKMEGKDPLKTEKNVNAWTDRHRGDYFENRVKFYEDLDVYLREKYGIKLKALKKKDVPVVTLKKIDED